MVSPGVVNDGWVEADAESIYDLGRLERHPLSEFGAQTVAIIRDAMRPSRREIVVRALRRASSSVRQMMPHGFEFEAVLGEDDSLVVAEEKLTRYLLDPDHPKGGSKARWFKSRLGFSPDDWHELLTRFREGLPRTTPEDVRIDEYGVSYRVDMEIEGLNGQLAAVSTVWIVGAEGPPAFVTAYPAE